MGTYHPASTIEAADGAKRPVAGAAKVTTVPTPALDSLLIFNDAIQAKGGEAVIPTRKNSTAPRIIDADRYKDRNLVERFWAKIKQYRRVATRYEKTARNFLAFVHVASIMILLQ